MKNYHNIEPRKINGHYVGTCYIGKFSDGLFINGISED